ncbi:MAG: ABC transporter permease subunit [Verrucomicrobiaceae bacterium]|nr:ABC transporter permease subunit [Verrucomicrobiaceae bacterium]
MSTQTEETRLMRIAHLRRREPRPWFLYSSLLVIMLVAGWAWTAGDLYTSVLTDSQRSANLERFIGKLTPAPVQASGDWSDFRPWAMELLLEGEALKAVGMTLALATAAAALSGFLALLFIPGAARNLATQKPLGISCGRGAFPAIWSIINKLVRLAFVFTRSLPEYILGFLLISILGPDPWALVLALAIHNFGILGRLGSEVVENAPRRPARTVIAHGGGRLGAYLAAILPESFNRMIVYFFYRWETCVREATILGMLGVVSLGYLIQHARAARSFDQMVFFVLLGALIVLAGDLLSLLVRRWLRVER